MTKNYIKLIYNPDLTKSLALPIESDMFEGTVIGWVLRTSDNTVEWLFDKDVAYAAAEISTFIGGVSKWLIENNLVTACWEGSNEYDQVAARIEHSFLSWLVKGDPNVPLIPFPFLRDAVNDILQHYPKDFRLLAVGEELDDYTNETGLANLDHYSLLNMLCHFHSESWVHKCERMTLIAYRHQMDIHPYAVAITPHVISELLNDKA